jgi:MtN3 and saliva related transmembrane protein
MEYQTIFDICGWIASIGLICGYLPQAIKTIRTGKTDGISLPGFIMMSVGGMGFMIQGWMLGRKGIFMFITNAITCVCSVIIFCIKMKNDYFRRKELENL